LPDSGTNCQSLCAACARAKTTAAGLPEARAWFATAPNVNATEIGLPDTGRVRTGIGIRGITTSEVRGWCAQAAGTFRFTATRILVTGGGIDPISSSSTTFAISHLQPPGMSLVSSGA
jgi:hypothetical protein